MMIRLLIGLVPDADGDWDVGVTGWRVRIRILKSGVNET